VYQIKFLAIFSQTEANLSVIL